MQLQPVILCGGSGTRLWPASRENYPKQFLTLSGAESMLQAAGRRLDGFSAAGVAAPLLVGNQEHRFQITDQLREIGLANSRLILEPAGRNTAPALTLAASVAHMDGADPILLVMPADHVIADRTAFQTAVTTGLNAAQQGAVVTFGVVPNRAETGYGYLRCGMTDTANPGVFALEGFVEKPDAATAKTYLDSGHYWWNSGIFMLRAGTWLKAIAALQPQIADACAKAIAGLRQDGDFVHVDREAFSACPADSIDYAVMEKLPEHPELAKPVAVPLDAGWSDIGSWDAVWENSKRNADGNVIVGEALLQDSRDSLVLALSRKVAVLGCVDLAVIETPDAVLVADRAHAQGVREVVAKLKAKGHEEVATHRKVQRPWGWYDSIERGPGFQVKRIGVNPGASLSLQMHHRRAEHWVVVRGTGRVTRGEEVFDLSENAAIFIPVGAKHRLENATRDPLEIIEVQIGDYLGEDDIVRFEDRYART